MKRTLPTWPRRDRRLALALCAIALEGCGLVANLGGGFLSPEGDAAVRDATTDMSAPEGSRGDALEAGVEAAGDATIDSAADGSMPADSTVRADVSSDAVSVDGSPVEAAPVDAIAIDVLQDSGQDAACGPTTFAPRPSWPAVGMYWPTQLRPGVRFRWVADCPLPPGWQYELALTPIPFGAVPPSAQAQTMLTAATPTTTASMELEGPIPSPSGTKGERVLWGVRACDPLVSCTPWSTSYFNYDRTPGDFNGDGLADVAVLDCESQVTVYDGRSNALPAATGMSGSYSPTIEAIVWADVNGDGFADLVLLTQFPTTAILQIAPGGLVFPSPEIASNITVSLTFDSAVQLVPAGDLNADGYEDVAIANGTHGLVLFGGIVGDGGGPAPVVQDLVPQSGYAFVGSVTNGFDPLATGMTQVVLGATGQALVLEGFSGPHAASTDVYGAASLASGTGAFVAGGADLNGDGLGDVVVGATGSSGVYVLGSSLSAAGAAGTPSLTPLIAPATGSPSIVQLASLGDVNGDGLSDVGAAQTNAGVVLLGFPGDWPETAGTVWPGSFAIPALGSIYGVGDVNGDGYADLAVVVPTSCDGGAATSMELFAGGGQAFSASSTYSGAAISVARAY